MITYRSVMLLCLYCSLIGWLKQNWSVQVLVLVCCTALNFLDHQNWMVLNAFQWNDYYVFIDWKNVNEFVFCLKNRKTANSEQEKHAIIDWLDSDFTRCVQCVFEFDTVKYHNFGIVRYRFVERHTLISVVLKHVIVAAQQADKQIESVA